jgi:hypothetical protein
MLVVVSIGSSSSSCVGGFSVIDVVRAEIMPMVEVGYVAACMDVSWVERRSRSSLTV